MILTLLACDLDAPADPSDSRETMFVVPKGATGRGLGEDLAAAHLIDSATRWTWFLRSADASCVKAGRHPLRPSLTKAEILASLCAAPVPLTEDFTVVEGWRIRDIDAALADRGWIQAGAYAAVASDSTKLPGLKVPFPVPPNAEGYLFPETYRVEVEPFRVEDLIRRQLETFGAKFARPYGGDLGGRTLSDIVIMASMIEREEPTPANRPVVAGILWKRIDAGWNLGVDATSRYTLDDWNNREAFIDKLFDKSDPWNTRLKSGLPPTAIGNPGLVALQAAAAPVASEFWYYLHDKTQTFHGARDVRGHEANRARYNVY